jgi:hypothetical protein
MAGEPGHREDHLLGAARRRRREPDRMGLRVDAGVTAVFERFVVEPIG